MPAFIFFCEGAQPPDLRGERSANPAPNPADDVDVAASDDDARGPKPAEVRGAAPSVTRPESPADADAAPAARPKKRPPPAAPSKPRTKQMKQPDGGKRGRLPDQEEGRPGHKKKKSVEDATT